jgi:protein-tyrosine phosphatase
LVLFLGTRNLHRSRFAEILFEHEAAKAKLDWWAISRGLERMGQRNTPAMLSATVVALARLRIATAEPRAPMQVALSDLEAASMVIAMDEIEQRPLIERRFPALATPIEYWDARDVISSACYDPLVEIDARVRAVVRRLALEATPLPALAS